VSDEGSAEERAELYRRLPVLDSDRWWLELARAAPGGRVLELGAGAGRLTAAFLDAGLEVTAVERDPAMLAALRARVGDRAQVVAADVTALPPLPAAGLVVLPSSLLNELPGTAARRQVLAGAARRCRPDGRVALHLLGPWWLAALSGRTRGTLRPSDGTPDVGVTITAGPFDAWGGRRRARLDYRFADGASLQDHLDAAIVTGEQLSAELADAGLSIEQRCGAAPPGGSPDDGPAWHLVCRPTG
jgi:SAM-dependent methyltransferase